MATRNQAAVDTYLSYCDPDTHEPLFGQRGLVFCAGVTHARDVANQFNLSLEPREGDDRTILRRKAATRKHLRENGIQLAAHMEGNMTNQERDELFEGHAQGKVLILCSDQMLKEGYDRPEDSFCMNLADTLSIVDAKQRNGRVFRLDEADEYKFATTFDFVDDERYEAVKHNRQLLPIFCPEILGKDWEFREPRKRPGQVTRKIKGRLDEAVLQHSDFEVIYDPQRVRDICNERQGQREEAGEAAPDATPGWLSAHNIAKQYGGTNAAHSANIAALRDTKLAELQATGMDEESAKREVEKKWGAWARPSHGNATWFVSPEGLKELIATERVRIDRAPLVKPNWLSGNAIVTQYGGSGIRHNTNIMALRDVKLAELHATGMDEEGAQKEVEEKWVAWTRSFKSGQEAWHISPEGLEELIHIGKIPAKKNRTECAQLAKPNWLSGAAIAKQYGGVHATHSANIVALRDAKLAELQATGMDEESAQREIDEKWVAWAKPKTGKDTWFVSPEGLKELIATKKVRTERAPPSKPNWLSGNSIQMQYGGGSKKHNTNIVALREAKLAELEAAGMDEGAARRRVEDRWVAWARSSMGNEAWHISPDGLKELIHTKKVRTDLRRQTESPER